MPRILSSPSGARSRRKKPEWKREGKRKWKCRGYSEEGKIKVLLRRQRRNSAWYIYFVDGGATPCGNQTETILAYLFVKYDSTHSTEWRGALSAVQYRQMSRRDRNNESSRNTDGEVELSLTLTSHRHRLVSRRNFRVKIAKLFPATNNPPSGSCFFQSRCSTQFYGEAEFVPAIVLPHLHFAFIYFLSPYFRTVFM